MMLTELWEIIPGWSLDVSGMQSERSDGMNVVGSTAVIPVVGPMSKYGGWQGASTLRARATLRAAIASDAVDSIMMYFDSPGGTVAGSLDFAMDIRQASQIKPVFAYGSDLLASAAYKAASQAGKVFANEAALIGSIGVMSALVDSKQLYTRMGVTVYPVTSGGVKGMGMPGTAITPDHRAYQQSLIDQMANQFVNTVAMGRGMQPAAVQKLADGKMHTAADAAKLGLIDGVMALDESISRLQTFARHLQGNSNV